jgi:hypothetical protein
MSRLSRSPLALVKKPLALLAATLILRSAGFAFGILNIDESDFTVFGAALVRGYLPYRDLVDIKPPLLFLTYLPAGLFGGMHILPMRILGVFWVFATAMVLRAAVRHWLIKREPELAEDAGVAAGWLYLLALLCEVPSLGGEPLLNLPVACALYCLARAFSEIKPHFLMIFWTGLFVGLASLYKHQGAVGLIAFGAAIALSALRDPTHPIARALLQLVSMALGFALPWAAAIGFYAALHALPFFIDWVFLKNLHLSSGGNYNGSPLEHFVQSTLLCCGATLIPWTFAIRATGRALSGEIARARGPSQSPTPKAQSPDLFLISATLLLWLTWLAVGAGGRFYEHYYLQFAPPLAVLAAPEFARLTKAFSNQSSRLKVALILGCALPVLGSVGYSWARGAMGAYPSQEPKTREVAAFIRANSTPAETMFVWGHFTPIYVLSQRLPGTRYEHTSVHMGNYDPAYLPESFDASRFRSDQDVAQTLEDLANRKPALIVDTAPADIHHWHHVPLSAFPDLRAYIETNYRVIGHPANATVYRRNGT